MQQIGGSLLASASTSFYHHRTQSQPDTSELSTQTTLSLVTEPLHNTIHQLTDANVQLSQVNSKLLQENSKLAERVQKLERENAALREIVRSLDRL